MTDLAVIFRPGILNHPSHEMIPTEHRLNQQVLEFLIAHQDWFMLDVPPPQRNDSILGQITLPQPKRDIYAMPSQTVGEGEWEGKVGTRSNCSLFQDENNMTYDIW